MKTAIIGGTFNPPHLAHLQLACEVFALGNYKKIVFVPTNIPAHKPGEALVSGKIRLEMLKLCLRYSFMDIDDCELKRGGVSYTVETLEYFTAKYNEKPAFILGDDLLAGFGKWKNPDLVAKKSDLIIARRAHREKQDFAWPHIYLDNPVLDISSSDIRSRIKTGKPISYLVEPAVEKYIGKMGLYKKKNI